ncbi:Uncharacterised protein [Yersinia pseudotuberculosis]|nr:Uncharacterised protein [Yersinia pseudotuberculosis]
MNDGSLLLGCIALHSAQNVQNVQNVQNNL